MLPFLSFDAAKDCKSTCVKKHNNSSTHRDVKIGFIVKELNAEIKHVKILMASLASFSSSIRNLMHLQMTISADNLCSTKIISTENF